MFSKALFKQSCKANGTMWCIITGAVCFMLACVMLISGNGNIGEVKNSIQDTIITKEIDSQMQKRAVFYYSTADDGLRKFDEIFSDNAADTLSYLVWYSSKPDKSEYADEAIFAAATSAWSDAKPEAKTDVGQEYALSVDEWLNSMPNNADEVFSSTDEYIAAMDTWKTNSPLTQENAVTIAFSSACDEIQSYIEEKSEILGNKKDSDESTEMLGSVMYTLNPAGNFNDFYEKNGEKIPEEYDFLSLISHISEGDAAEYIHSEAREQYRQKRAENGASIFLAGAMSESKSIDALVEALSSYGVTREKYNDFGYTYGAIKHMSKTAIVTYSGRTDYEISLINEKYENGNFSGEDEYLKAVAEKKEEIANDISSSFLSTLPSAVSEALEEIGQADLYTLIVGSIFYKLAGLLLPIIYMIMASNNLISGQVDSGSMAYVLSTSTKRSTVVFTQAVYLIGSLLAMFSLTSITSCICLAFVTEEVELTYKNLLLLNLGAFLVLFALSGLCFFTSCVFDRSKRSMAIGGGLSIFALVAAMLGLFGSPVIPSVIRLDSLNYFNYATIISLFDVVSVIEGTDAFVFKLAVLAVLGVTGYVIGSIRFTKKDLPL